MKKLALAVVLSATVLLGVGGMASAQDQELKYRDLVGIWNVNIESCRPCVMTITAIDARGNVTGTHTSLRGEITPLTGKIVERKGGLWLIATAEYGMAVIETAFCEDESDGYYTIAARVPTHHRANYKKIAPLS